MCLPRIGVEVVELDTRKPFERGGPIALEAPLDGAREVRSRTDHQVVAAAGTVAVEEQGCLVDTIDHAVGRDVLRPTAQAGEGGEEIADVKNVTTDLPRLDHTRHTAIRGTREPPSVRSHLPPR